MQLNSDCVRDTLLAIEEAGFYETLKFNELCEKLPQYNFEDIWYTCLKLKEGGYLDVLTLETLNCPKPQIARIKDITFQGHEFLNSVRGETNWEKTKDIAKKTGAFSLKALSSIAQGVVTAAINSQFQF